MLLTDARAIADHVIALLAPACQRIEVAGSIRREKAEVKDIEIVALPEMGTNLFGEPQGSKLDDRINDLVYWGKLDFDKAVKRNGERYKRLLYATLDLERDIAIDLFIASEANYGNTLAIRTGNSDFSRLLVTQRIHGGLMRPTMRQRDGYLWAQGDGDAFDQLVPCPEEKHFFAALGVHPVPAPRERDAVCIEGLRRAIA